MLLSFSRKRTTDFPSVRIGPSIKNSRRHRKPRRFFYLCVNRRIIAAGRNPKRRLYEKIRFDRSDRDCLFEADDRVRAVGTARSIANRPAEGTAGQSAAQLRQPRAGLARGRCALALHTAARRGVESQDLRVARRVGLDRCDALGRRVAMGRHARARATEQRGLGGGLPHRLQAAVQMDRPGGVRSARRRESRLLRLCERPAGRLFHRFEDTRLFRRDAVLRRRAQYALRRGLRESRLGDAREPESGARCPDRGQRDRDGSAQGPHPRLGGRYPMGTGRKRPVQLRRDRQIASAESEAGHCLLRADRPRQHGRLARKARRAVRAEGRGHGPLLCESARHPIVEPRKSEAVYRRAEVAARGEVHRIYESADRIPGRVFRQHRPSDQRPAGRIARGRLRVSV